MLATLVPRCDCCGLIVDARRGEHCPRCGYPVSVQKETQFLETSLHDLQRVAMYGGARATVVNLIQRYRMRLNALQQQKYAVAIAQQHTSIVPMPTPVAQPPVPNVPIAPTSGTVPPVQSTTPQIPTDASVSPSQSASRHVFSLQSFLAEQTITIVSSLGAFLILIGSLSFVVTTSNLFLSFLVVCVVHAVFAVVGFFFNRFPAFRLMARIYLIIFALLVPLVGFSGYRLVSGQLLPLSTSTIVAIAATYAAIVYAILAISQQFRLFGYLSVVSLVLADLAAAFSLHLGYWWWPSLLIPLAFASLATVQRGASQALNGRTAILREPVHVMMYTCIAVLVAGLFITLMYSLILDTSAVSSNEVRTAIAVMTVLLLSWTGLFSWLAKRIRVVVLVPYQFLGCVLAFAYILEFRQIGYTVAFTAVAVVYHVIIRFVRQPLQHLSGLRFHMEGISLILVGLIPFIITPILPVQLLGAASVLPNTMSGTRFALNTEAIVGCIVIVLACALSIDTLLGHTGLKRTPAQLEWRWLTLLSCFLFTWAYSIVMLALHIVPVWGFFGLTFACIIAAVVMRRAVSSSWSEPFDVLTLCEIALTLLLSLSQRVDVILSLLLFYAALSYGVILYQQRRNWLFLPLVFIVCAVPLLFMRPAVLFVIAVLLPFASVLVHLSVTRKRTSAMPVASTVVNAAKASTLVLAWEWPLLVSSLFCGAATFLRDVLVPTSTLQEWTRIFFPVALEMAVFSLTWYAAAALARVKWWLSFAIGFAVISLLLPTNSFFTLLWIAPIAALLAVGVSRLAGKSWAMPFYTVAMLAAVMMGIAANGNVEQVAQLPGVLLIYAIVAYGAMLFERRPIVLLLPVLLTAWAILQVHWNIWQQMVAFCSLCVFIFAAQYVWRILAPKTNVVSPASLHTMLGLGGQLCVVLAILLEGGLAADSGLLAHVGAGALFILAALFFWYGRIASVKLRLPNYVAGLLISLAVSWELVALRQTHIDWLTLAPATYLIVIAPFLSRDQNVSRRHLLAQICSIFGSALLLLPALWLSFSQGDVQPTLILIGESLALLMIGVVTRVRIFVLSGVGLVIVAALHALFLPSLELPPSLALTIMGVALLVLATALSLARHRLQRVWTQLD